MEVILQKEMKLRRAPKKRAPVKKHNITQLKKELRQVMMKHGMKSTHASHAIKHLHGAGFFDFIKKAVGAVKKGIGFYNEHKDAIHGAIGKAKEVYGKAKDAYEGYKEDGLRGAFKKVAGGSKSGGGKSGGRRLRKKGVARSSPWITKCKEYAS